MANFRGYFRGFDRIDENNPNGDLYCVHIGDFSAETFTELTMASNPFVVQYNTSNTPFDPVRTSVATIRIINEYYVSDLFPTSAQELPVVLYNETVGRVEWCGFVTPKVYDGDYTNCLEEIDIEAADCLSSLQYIDYTPYSAGTKSIVSVNKILGSICNASGLLTRFFWTNGKMYDGSNPMLPETLFLSEQNFFSSDTDEPWKMSEVLEEICRYFGFTAVQHGNAMYLIDFLQYKTQNQLISRFYDHSNDYDFVDGSIYYMAGGHVQMTKDFIRENGGNISLEPIYNKCTVKANMYACERIIPSIFEDGFLQNRLSADSYYTALSLDVPRATTPTYPYGSAFLGMGQSYHDDDGGPDDKYQYFLRIYDHQSGWTSVYKNDLTEPFPKTQQALVIDQGATIVDLGVVRNDYEEYGQKIIASKLDYTRYLMVNQKNTGYRGNTPNDYLVFKMTKNANICPFSKDNSYLVIQGSANYTKYEERPYINPDWDTNAPKIGGEGSEMKTDGYLCFLVKVGDKYWDGSGWTSTRKSFVVALKKSNDGYGCSNTDRKILNNVRWNLEIGEDGYLIPLSGASFSLTDNIEIEVHMPTLQWTLNNTSVYNGWVWIKDFDIKLVQKGQDSGEDEGDMVYENVINDDAVSEISDITCKITSYTSGVSPSYSTAMYSNNGVIMPLSGFVDNSSNVVRAGEENIVQKYVDEYQHQTKKITYTIESQLSGLRPWTRFYNFDPAEPNQMFVVLGEEIDYQNGTNTITAVELK